MRRVFIAWTHALFFRSVCLLLDSPQITIVGDSQELATAQAELEALRPDTIIVEKPETEETPGCANALQLAQTSVWNPRIICVSLQDNTVWSYQRQQHTLEEAGDLLHLIVHT